MIMTMRFRPSILLVTLTMVLACAASAAAQMRVVTYNCAQILGVESDFQDVLDRLMVDDKPGFATAPWVVVFQEVQSFLDDDLLAHLNLAAPPGITYAQATYTSSVIEDNSAGAIALYYRTDKLSEVAGAHIDIPTGANRNTDRWLLILNDYPDPQIGFYVYGSHLKADNDPPDIAERNAGCQAIRNNAATLPADAKIIYLGDFNFYTNSEAGYLTMIAPGTNRAIDALGNVSWFGSTNAIKHTQSPCATSCFLVGGGLDDRFDFIFFTAGLNNSTGLGRMLGTYRSFGNDGMHYNTDIDAGNNFYYPGDLARSNALADALRRASDHIPVILDFRLPAIAHAEFAAPMPIVIEGAVITHPLTITNLADAPTPACADALNYTAIPTGGFTGGGSGSVGPLPDADDIALALDTSTPGFIDCGALILSSGQEVQNAEIILSTEALVLRHAAPSFAPGITLDEQLVTVHFDADTGVQIIEVPVYNAGFDELQALLDVDAVSPATPPFAFEGGLASDVGPAPATLTFSFDTAGVRPGTYADSYTIEVSDEDLPGAAMSTLALELEVVINKDKQPPCTGDMVSSQTFAPPPDGSVDGADLAFLLGEWGANPGSPADIVTSDTFQPPLDGVVDGADLAVLLGAWGACD